MRRRSFLKGCLAAALISVAPSWGFDVAATRRSVSEQMVMYDRYLKEWYSLHWEKMCNEMTTVYKLFRRTEDAPLGAPHTVSLRHAPMGVLARNHDV